MNIPPKENSCLVTGANGFVGAFLVKALLEKGYKVTALVRRSSNLFRLQGLKINFLYGELTDSNSLLGKLGNFDYIFHVAGITKAKSAEDYLQVNVLGTKNLLEACLKDNPKLKRFVFISTQSVLGPNPTSKPFNENSVCQPISFYGKSKLEAEKIVLSYLDKFPITIVRPPSVYGPSDPDLLTFFQLIKFGIKPVFTKKDSFLNLCYIENLSKGIILAAESPLGQSQIYFLADDKVYSWREAEGIIQKVLEKKAITVGIPKFFLFTVVFFVENISRILGKPAALNREKAREFCQRYWLCDINKAKKELGYHPKFDLEEGVAKTVKWYKENGWL
jgi:dihydroflavonol-4-reductase